MYFGTLEEFIKSKFYKQKGVVQMRKKITAINIGVVLTIEENGREKKFQMAGISPSPAFPKPEDAIKRVEQFIADHSGKNKAVRKAVRK